MWRKQDQAKPASAPAEAAVPAAAEVSAPASVSAAVSTAVPAIPAKKNEQNVPLAGARLTGSLRIKGEISGNEDLFIDAQVEGSVQLEGATVVVGSNGSVAASVAARNIVVQGEVQGSLDAMDSVRLGPTGIMQGDIRARRLLIEDGAEIRGHVETVRTVAETAAEQPRVPTMEDVAVPRAAQSAEPAIKESSAVA